MLNKLYSDTNLLLKDFEFHSGLNFIIGEYSKDKDATGINGIGKSTLVRLIDYCLLSEKAEKIFNQNKYDFLREEEHNICLDISVNEKEYTIKRFFNKTVAYFGPLDGTLNEYTLPEIKDILGNKFFTVENEDVVYLGNRYRTLMNFFIKDDLDNQKRLDPLDFMGYGGGAKEKYLYNFYLLNLPTKKLIQYTESIQNYNKWNKTIKGLEEKIVQSSGKSLSEFKSEKLSIEKKVKTLETSLVDYKFLDEYKSIESNLIGLTAQINEKLKTFYALDGKLKQIKQSYHFDENVDLERVKKIYNDVLNNFGDLVTKKIEEIIDFKKEILGNRKKFLVKKEVELEKEINSILDDVKLLEHKRSSFYRLLDERGAMESITNTYKQLVEEKIFLEQNVQELKQIDDIQTSMTEIDISISENKAEITEVLKKQNRNIDNLRYLFQEILKDAIFLDEQFSNAYFDIEVLPKTRRDSLPFKIEISIPKAEALGQSRLRIVVYDLMVFLNNMGLMRHLPNFLIHDGVFHGIATKTKLNVLNFLYHKHLENQNFQYFTTFNEDEIYSKDGTFGTTDFDIEKLTVAKFSDSEEKTIFKRIFK